MDEKPIPSEGDDAPAVAVHVGVADEAGAAGLLYAFASVDDVWPMTTHRLSVASPFTVVFVSRSHTEPGLTWSPRSVGAAWMLRHQKAVVLCNE